MAMHKLQIREVVRAPVVLWNPLVSVGFLAIFQVLVTPRTEPLWPLQELAISRRRGLGLSPSLSPSVLEGRIIWGIGRGDEPMAHHLGPGELPEGGMTHCIQKDPAVLPGAHGMPPVLRGSPPA
jgi:hypothetical protein